MLEQGFPTRGDSIPGGASVQPCNQALNFNTKFVEFVAQI